MDLFALVPALGMRFEPVLNVLDQLLDDDQLFQQVKADVARWAPKSLTRGRRWTPVEVILRVLVVKRLHGWSYAQIEDFVSDSLVLRQFCRLYAQRVPNASRALPRRRSSGNRWRAFAGWGSVQPLKKPFSWHVGTRPLDIQLTL